MLPQMSLFVVLLLLLSFHASCDAPIPGVLNAAQFHHLTTKENVKLHPARVSTHPGRKASIQNDAAKDIAEEEMSRFEKHIAQTKNGLTQVPDTQKSEPVASVSWRVPHRKGGQPESGFNSDYLPPKTHPSIHN